MFVKLALAGAGLVGRRHIDAIAACEGVALSSIADPNESVRHYAEKVGVPWYGSLTELFHKEQPDGIILATPNQVHVENGMECVNARCPMLVEKPLATSASEGKLLVDAAAAAKVPVLVGHHRRHSPLVRKAREIINAGKLGRLRVVSANCWLYKPDDYFDKAPWRKRKGAGPVSVNLVHDVDLIRYLCGDVVSVQAQATKALRGYDNEDVAGVVLRFDGDVLGTMSVSDSVVAPWSWELTARENPVYPYTGQSCYLLGGSHGALSLPDLTLWKNADARSWWAPMNATTHEDETSESLVNQIKQFAQVIGGATPLVSGEEGVKTLSVIEAIHQSAASGKTVYLQ